MSTSLWTMAVGGAAGVALALFGVSILVTGRGPAFTARAFRCVRDAGYYHLLFGVALVLVVIGTSLDRALITVTTTLLAIASAGVAMIRFRPRGHRDSHAGGRG
jgi:hypothetical protein